MTLADVGDVIFDDKVLSNRTAIEQLEAKNHQAALYWLLDQVAGTKGTFAITEELIFGAHLRLMNGIVSDAGQYRKHTVRIMNPSQNPIPAKTRSLAGQSIRNARHRNHRYASSHSEHSDPQSATFGSKAGFMMGSMGTHVPLANWQKVPALVTQLVSATKSTDDIVAALAKTHADFEKIHPFSDGNGRTGRLLLLAQALDAGVAPPIVAKERKRAYYKCLEIAQTTDNYLPLELFVAESVQFSARLLLDK